MPASTPDPSCLSEAPPSAPRPGLLARALVGGVRVYQFCVSPALHALGGANCGCRFRPTCSHYAIGALRTHGAFKGALLTAWRLLKCQPFHPGGEDPVPPARTASRFSCVRVEHPANTSFLNG